MTQNNLKQKKQSDKHINSLELIANRKNCIIKLFKLTFSMRKKSLKILILSLLITSLVPIKIVVAGTTILPNLSGSDLEEMKQYKNAEDYCEGKGYIYTTEDYYVYEKSNSAGDKYLYCAVVTGEIHLWMIPYFLVYWTESLLQIAGIIAVLMFVMGGLFYILGGISETITKEKGKTTMKWALMGMALSFLSWVLVNVVIYFVSQ